ncbi:hypothetical protein SAMN04488134_102144 [Amphibacillus marinus]|uniref:Uncharacterized protein n=1 Tax=Amphibacillus marinus TaxID=872970 RepID=A0A1H8K2B3_9BACI|nr:hypothetical protein [Amphibacillus marinus]SEN86945.1 hypothetical protein SAMN04488134_102144 [Amphibacillus marinus]
MTDFSAVLELECSTGLTITNLEDMEGALELFYSTLEGMREHPRISAHYVEEGIITKQLLAIHRILKSIHEESHKEMEQASRIIETLAVKPKEEAAS